YRSLDALKTYEKVLELDVYRKGVHYPDKRGMGGVWADPQTDLVVAFCSADQYMYSTDGGATWNPMSSFDGFGDIEFHPMDWLIASSEPSPFLLRTDDLDGNPWLIPNFCESTGQVPIPGGGKWLKCCVSRATGLIYGAGYNTGVWVAGLFTPFVKVLDLSYSGRPIAPGDGYVYIPARPYSTPSKPAPLVRIRELTLADLEKSANFWGTRIPVMEIRDTGTYYSNTYLEGYTGAGGDIPLRYGTFGLMKGASKATIMIRNSTDQDATVQVEGLLSYDKDWPGDLYSWLEPVPIGSSFTVPAGSIHYETLTDPFPWIRLRISFATAPTEHDIRGWIFFKR
ncbi:MAG: hypothetical protein DRP01_10885, partial [Archaeoglobales archaeon]